VADSGASNTLEFMGILGANLETECKWNADLYRVKVEKALYIQ
jgi:hypothetical protein